MIWIGNQIILISFILLYFLDMKIFLIWRFSWYEDLLDMKICLIWKFAWYENLLDMNHKRVVLLKTILIIMMEVIMIKRSPQTNCMTLRKVLRFNWSFSIPKMKDKRNPWIKTKTTIEIRVGGIDYPPPLKGPHRSLGA